MLTTLVLAAAIAAQQPNCTDPHTQADMNICSGRDYKEADAALNRQWNATVVAVKEYDKDLDRTYDKRPSYFAALLDGQRAWLTYRDAYCVSEGYVARGGSMEPLLVNTCLTEITNARTKQLKDLTGMYNN